ncbi:MAG: GatB/YqeY domain-containing protein [Alphaproteobacteria bacterium]|nr:GatB/YqeY domain-containing protein [Alphaproteobacteria bacterium]MCW5743091.1 GatB/YqeY domain-containing protein [Alphaproteobacteria bacterium]
MLRDRFNEALKDAMRAKDMASVSTIRLMIARLKEWDIEARAKGNRDGVADAEILQMLSGMVKQRGESIAAYQQGNRQDLADKEQAEIDVIRRFMPRQLDAAGIEVVIAKGIAETGASGIKGMGPLMAWLKANYAGQMDFAAASAAAKKALGG